MKYPRAALPGCAVTAYSMANALGVTTPEVISALSASRSGLGPSPLDLPFETRCGAVPDPLPAPPPSLAAYDCREGRLALALLEGIAGPLNRSMARWGRERVAMVMGTSTGGIDVTERAYFEHRRTGRFPDGYDYRRQHSFHAFSELLRRATGLGGPAYVVSTACSSSGKVFASARRLLASGLADAVLVGGVDVLCHTTLRGFFGLSVLAPDTCRPFGLARKGINIGEGGAMVLLERSGEARAVLLGVGESSDAFHMTSPHPQGLGARAAMADALAEANLPPSAVDYINAHGTGTRRNDAAEAIAVADLFGDRVPPVVSTKGYTGHMLGAAGATEAVFAIVALEHGFIPASLGSDPPDPEIRIAISQKREQRACRVVMSNSFGFGGSNVSVVLGAVA